MNKLKIGIWKICLLFTLIWTFSCKNLDSEDQIIRPFPNSHQLVGNILKGVPFISKGNVNLFVVDTFLILQRNEEKCIQFYSTSSHKFLTDFGNNGSGPGEFTSPLLTNHISYTPILNSPLVHVYDYALRRFTQIDVIKAAKNKRPFYEAEEIPNVGSAVRYFFYKDSSLLLVTPEAPARFLFYDYKASNIKTIPFIPKLDFDFPPDLLDMVYRSATYVDRERGLIVSAPVLLGEIDFFDLNGNLLYSTFFDSNSKDNLELSEGDPDIMNSKVKFQIVSIQVVNDLIFCLNYNNPGNRFNGANGAESQKIQVFDWEGTPVREYILDDHFITAFAVDPIHNRIYGYDPNLEEENILIYEF